MERITEIYRYRQMIAGLVHRELRGRYKGSVLGFMWTFINPLLQLGVYTLLFSVIFKSEVEHYPIFLFVALVPWLFFSSCISGGCNAVISSGDLLKKIYFPREVLPFSFVISSFVNMLYCFIVVFAVILLSGFGLNPAALIFLPVIMIIEFIFCFGMTFILSAATVYVRDLPHIMGIITMLWQFMSPVMYSSSRVPENLRSLFMLNPMAPILESYREILYYRQVPHLETLRLALLFGIFFALFGEFVFARLQRNFAEEL